MQPAFIQRNFRRGNVVSASQLTRLAQGLNRMNAGVSPPQQVFPGIGARPYSQLSIPLPQGLTLAQTKVRVLTLATVPGTQYKSAAPYSPYALPDVNQYFNYAQITAYLQSSGNGGWTDGALFVALFQLFSLDSMGADIELAAQGNFGLTNSSVATGVIHGGKFWEQHVGENVNTLLGYGPSRIITASMPICGWRSTLSVTSGSGTITIAPNARAFIQELN
jgi:hypothetical protein